ncbi:D-arabinono-1,4-lactone oxidase [Pseudolycoriella hygida]|uniref:D-arabinono-1,4-lactone oxidase n=1 Tax=Pseudolycoriella hygida TaxID=35572 RepID=A0A9Q0S7P6_9DIPT|nr:D-arabinono-1,4-lactone oxidase [Pseudolycoriella hygida]
MKTLIFLYYFFLLTYATSAETPPNFPSNIPLRIGTYKNWGNDLIVPNIWFATPSNDRDVVTLANWAHANNFKLRANGFMHNWAPMTVTNANKYDKNIILVDTTEAFTKMQIISSPYADTSAVRVGSGASLHNLLSFLEENGLGVYSSPSVGKITIGGILAIGGHGTSVLAKGEKTPPGFSYGTMSNLVISLTAVVWSPQENSYVLKTFDRTDPDTKAFLVNLGRTFITEVTLMVGPNYNLRCESRADILSDELFADPENVRQSSRTFSRFLDETGRIETILFPFSNTPWLKKWSIIGKRPNSLLSVKVNSPYNYPLTNIFSEQMSMIVGNITNNFGLLNPILGPAQSLLSSIANFALLSFDIWGPSKNLLLYVKDTTLRQTGSSFVVITKRSNVQKIVSRATAFYKKLLRDYSAANKFPINGVMEIRASALDYPYGVVPDGDSPTLSSLHPIEGRPELDTGLWITILSFKNAEYQNEALQKVERFFFDTIDDGINAIVRPEWSKGYGYTNEAPWTNTNVLKKIPSKFPDSSTYDGWNFAASTFAKYDPHWIFSNDYLNELFGNVSQSKLKS